MASPGSHSEETNYLTSGVYPEGVARQARKAWSTQEIEIFCYGWWSPPLRWRKGVEEAKASGAEDEQLRLIETIHDTAHRKR